MQFLVIGKDGTDEKAMERRMAVMDFPSEKELQKWLKQEPSVTGQVWKSIEIVKCNVKNPWKFNRPRSFFESRKK